VRTAVHSDEDVLKHVQSPFGVKNKLGTETATGIRGVT
jgi:hypothetical protein